MLSRFLYNLIFVISNSTMINNIKSVTNITYLLQQASTGQCYFQMTKSGKFTCLVLAQHHSNTATQHH